MFTNLGYLPDSKVWRYFGDYIRHNYYDALLDIEECVLQRVYSLKGFFTWRLLLKLQHKTLELSIWPDGIHEKIWEW